MVPRGTVYAVDVEPKMLEHIRKRAAGSALTNLVAVQGDSVSPRLPKAVDLALVVDTYHHIPNRVDYFKRLATGLTAGGRLAIIDFRKDAPDGPPPEFRFEAAQIVEEMTKAGYRLDADHAFLPRQHFLVFRTGASGREASVASGFSRKAVAVANLWISSRSLPAEAGSHAARIESDPCAAPEQSQRRRRF